MDEDTKGLVAHGALLIRHFKAKLIGPVDNERIEKRLTTNSRMTLGYLLMLLAACMIALLGLLMNSSAVIIGAMLISPLMDPILGGAFAIATMNRTENIKNIARMAGSIFIVGVFVLIFMKFSPISDMTPEIMARTKPNLFDLFVALFAAVAGTYVLITGQGGNTIPGVAIATALMPPLVTIFYGISIGDWGVARGAAYLFITNFATITFAAILIIWFVGFRPEYEEKNRLYRIMGRQFAVFMAIILILSIPLTRTLVTISREARMNSQSRKAVYAVKDRIPRVYPWMNEPGTGILEGWNMSVQGTAYIIFNTMWYGYVNTGAGS